MAATQITIYPPDTVAVTVATPAVVQLQVVEQLVVGSQATPVSVQGGLGIDVTGPSGGAYTVSVEFAASGTSSATQAVRADDSRLSDARTPTGAAGGDLTGTYPSPTVHRVHGNDFQSGTPSDKDVWSYHAASTNWQHRTLAQAGISAVGHTHTSSDITGLGAMALLGSTAAGDLTGTWPNLQLGSKVVGTAEIANGAVQALQLASDAVETAKILNGAVTLAKIQDIPTQTLVGRGTIGTGTPENIGLSSDFGIDPSTYELKLTNRSANSIIGRSASTGGAPADIAATADGQVLGRRAGTLGFGAPLAGGSATQVQVNVGGDLTGFATLTYDSGLNRMTVGSVALLNGEYVRNTVDGRIDFMPNPHPSGDFGLYLDLTSSAFYAKIGTIDSAGGLNTNSGVQFDNTLAIIAGKALDFGNTGGLASYYAQTTGNGAWYLAPYIGSGNAGSVCLVSQNAQGDANRRPATAHTNPTLYVYAAGFANANDFARLSHDATDATLESGRGKLRLKGASAVRVESSTGGYDLPATAGSNGQVLTTNGTSASWQTPSGGGVAFDEVMRIAHIGT